MYKLNGTIVLKNLLNKKVRILQTGCFLDPKSYMFMPQLFQYFLPSCFTYEVVDKNSPADICIFSICMNDKALLRKNEINILISIENLPHWNWHLHYTKYHDFNNDMVDIFFYNHKYIVKNTEKYLMIPTVIPRVEYFKQVENKIYFKETPFKEKKFAFIINSSLLNKPIMEKCKSILQKYGEVDTIANYRRELQGTHIYNHPKFLELFNRFKFIICIENSPGDGYITEKIFNCFLAKTIPIYNGCDITSHYINRNSYFNAFTLENNIDKLLLLRDNETKYNNFVSIPKISTSFMEQNAKELLTKRILTNKQ